MIDHHLHIKENKPVAFSDATLEKIGVIISHYPEGQQKSALLPVLHIAQQELGGYLSVDVMDRVASLLNIQPVEVYEVATFYTMFHLEPVGKYVIEVCQTGPCAICGGEQILEHLEKSLGINVGETTPDGIFTLKTVECLGACGTAPVMQVNTEFHESLTAEKIDRIIGDLKEKSNGKTSEVRWAELF
ncbi:MAG: NADH-quinone oxidoreductase subunit NuoE [Bacteroidetes bacterium]|nr:NADH-quinone oxidoreductase subunit NuoE [Bacteroidota bacterium]